MEAALIPVLQALGALGGLGGLVSAILAVIKARPEAADIAASAASKAVTVQDAVMTNMQERMEHLNAELAAARKALEDALTLLRAVEHERDTFAAQLAFYKGRLLAEKETEDAKHP
jgi:hypothetical protein